MEGPTPVSALLHSATLVIAGVIIYTRTSANYQLSLIPVIICVGTVLVCVSHMNDPDIKKCAAISTCIVLSLLWIEVLASSSSAWYLAVTHAGYKSTLFVLLAYILTTCSSQDLRSFAWNGVSSITLVIILLYSCGVPGTYYAYAKLGSKLMCHSSSINRYCLSVVYVMLTTSLFVL